ncbi:DUF6196 family protein [Lentzea sp. HUAS TT2]|uniref:DUF6196 family protein n=1 Tax=Lentzea sp. HUAS TT2 TaxID=3447454 RepID=UPI003F703047
MSMSSWERIGRSAVYVTAARICRPCFGLSNRARGGIYDCWGCPVGLLDQAVAVVRTLRTS